MTDEAPESISSASDGDYGRYGVDPPGLDDYERGYLDALYFYAWWSDGVLHVGSTGATLASARLRFFRDRGRL